MPSSEPKRNAANPSTPASETEERLRLAMDVAGIGSWDWDLKNGRVVWSGDQEKMFGLPHGTFRGSFDTFLNFVHPDDVVGMQARTAGSLAERKTEHRDEFRIVRPDGTVRWMVANAHIFYDADGTPARMIGVNLDVTERKQAEQALRQSERLAATGRLAATIAHELNNPLASVTNVLFLLESQLAGSEENRALVRVAQEELGRMTRIVQQTLAFHRQSSEPVEFSVSELLDSVLALLEPRLRAQRIQIVRRFEGETALTGFPAELRQVFTNLVINASESMDRSGVIVVHVFPSRRWSNPDDHGTRIIVADTGNGIPPHIREHIFDPFFTTKGAKGSGVGLWVSSGIVAKHGGDMRVFSSTAGARTGTAFCVFLPEAEAQPEMAAPRKRVRTDRPPVQMGLDLRNSG